ncbi:MAG: DUF2892 domain-containing protein [Clostridia bacterium]|nr:DUF2892 domain-containing protein [Clostridia bacterium]
MADTEVFEKKENIPLESYTFTYTKEEHREAKKNYFSQPTAKIVVLSILVTAIIVYVLSLSFNFGSGLFVGIEAMWLLFSVLGLVKAKQTWKLSEAKFCSSVYTYELFEGYMFMKVTRENETVHLTKFEYADLRQKIDVGKYYLLNFYNQIYVIKKQELAENSIFHSIKPKEPEKPSATLRALSVVLLVLSIVSGVSGVLLIGSSMFNYGAMQWWYLLAFGLIPIASLVFGFYMKKYGTGKGNVIAGLLAFCFILGVFYAGYTDEPDRAEEYAQIEVVESYVGVPLPRPHSYDNFKGSVNGIDYEDTAMQFNSEAGDFIEGIIKGSDKWSAILTDEIYDLVYEVGTAEDWDYVCVYNITNDEYNKVPLKEGTYDMAAMYYDMEYNGLYVIEYEYAK